MNSLQYSRIAHIVMGLALAACESRSSTPNADVAVGARAEFANVLPTDAHPNGTVREFAIDAAPVALPLLDGKSLSVWAYNGQVPGPTLRIRLGETLRVHFTNHLPQDTTIHWHGIRLPHAMDGVPHLTQPPVPPGGSFTYEFTPKDAGTFWFHPHVRSSEQVERGLYGVLIVEEAAPLPYSRDVAWVLDDWRLDGTGQIAPEFNTRHDLAMDGRWGRAITVNGKSPTVTKVRPGERIRLRLLNSANGRVFKPDFGELDATIIAVDGGLLRAPLAANTLDFELAPGNRLDVDLVFNRSSTAAMQIVDRFISQRPNVLATFELDGDPVESPSFAAPRNNGVPHWVTALQVPSTHDFTLGARSGGEFGIEWTFDGVAFAGHHHDMPSLATLRANKFSRMHFKNTSARIHPIHTHGMFFKLLARNGDVVDEPFFRDTVIVHPREEIDIGVVPLDVGVWMMHCHILEHAEAGMMTTLDVQR
jgi:FtsP/CotA-like multicopper oxidase with cupredoxin domain